MQYFNNKQSKTIDELIQLYMLPDLAGDRWILKQVFLVPSKTQQEEFSLITICFIDKTNLVMFKYIDLDGNVRSD
jgi:hypothetical protein